MRGIVALSIMVGLVMVNAMVYAGDITTATETMTDQQELVMGKNAQICPGCGEIKGSENCCKAGVAKCGACGLHKGSAGCKKACSKKTCK